MEMPNLRTVGIGKLPKEKLEAKNCLVENVDTEYVEKAKLTKAIFILKHPDKEDSLTLSNVTLMKQKKDKKEIVSTATWVFLDKNNELAMDSALVAVLRFYGANSLTEMVGKTIKTDTDTEGYLTIKAY
jgi:hypothetical protein